MRDEHDAPRHRGARQIRHGNTLARPLRDYGPKDHVDVIVTNPPFGGMEEDGIESNFPTEFRTRETADLFLVLVMELLKRRRPGRASSCPTARCSARASRRASRSSCSTSATSTRSSGCPTACSRPYTGIKTNLLFFTKGEPTKDVWFYEHPYPAGHKSYSKTKPMRIEEFEPEKAWWASREGDRAGLEGHRRGHRRRRLQPRHHEPERGRRRPRGPRRAARSLRRATAEVEAAPEAFARALAEALLRG